MEEKTITYSNDTLQIHWKPERCIHSGICVKGLRAVFDPSRKKWIDPLAADSETIALQIDKCPSGALSYSKK